MTYPLELREDTYLSDNAYPVNLFRNHCPAGPIGRSALYLHWHEHFELIYMVSGQAVFHIDSQPYDVQPGDVLIVPSGGLHVGYASVGEALEYWSLVFNRSLLEGLQVDPIHARYLSPYLDGRLRFPVRIDRKEPICEDISFIVKRIGQEFEARLRVYELVVKSQLYQLFALLARAYLPERESEPASIGAIRRMDRFKALILHIEAHYADKLTISDAAKLVNLNPYHFCKVFKNATGLTFVEFVNQHRMNEAERLLREGDLTVTEVAERIGCGNPNYFTKLFKQVKGRTPSEARKKGDRLT